jgi:hypothetical protein
MGWSQILTIFLEVIKAANLLAFDWDGGQGLECVQLRAEEDICHTQGRSTNDLRLIACRSTFGRKVFSGAHFIFSLLCSRFLSSIRPDP